MLLLSSEGLNSLLGYIGPGGGMALLGPLLAVVCSAAGALALVAIWPIRRLIKRFHSSNGAATKRVEPERF